MQREVYTAYIHPYQRSTYNYRPKSLHRAEEHAADQRSNPLHKRKFPFLVRVKKVLHITHAFITIYIKRTANRKPNLSVYILATQVIHGGKKSWYTIHETRNPSHQVLCWEGPTPDLPSYLLFTAYDAWHTSHTIALYTWMKLDPVE
jgi:hypothetical protein